MEVRDDIYREIDVSLLQRSFTAVSLFRDGEPTRERTGVQPEQRPPVPTYSEDRRTTSPALPAMSILPPGDGRRRLATRDLAPEFSRSPIRTPIVTECTHNVHLGCSSARQPRNEAFSHAGDTTETPVDGDRDSSCASAWPLLRPEASWESPPWRFPVRKASPRDISLWPVYRRRRTGD